MLNDVLGTAPALFAIPTLLCFLLAVAFLFYSRTLNSSKTVLPTGIEALPLEILNDILVRLGYDDILRVREVSRYMNCATRMRSIWITLVKSGETRFMVDKLFELCTSQELEHLVRRKARRDANWNAQAGPIDVRSVPIDNISGWSFLLPGGRWLISGTNQAGIIYVDLDSDTCEWQTLIPDIVPKVFWQDFYMRLDMSESTYSDYISVHILLMTHRFRNSDELSPPFDSNSKTTRHLQVFHASVKFDDSGVISGLKADLLSSFHECGDLGSLLSVEIRGKMLAYHITNPEACIVVDWKVANGKIVNFPRKMIELSTSRSDFLSETVLYTWTFEELFLYDLSSPALPISMEPPNRCRPVVQDPIWSTISPISIPSQGQTTPIPADASTAVLFPSEEGILKLTFSEESLKWPSSLVMLSEGSTELCALRPDQAAEYRDNHLITYKYHKTSGGTILSTESFKRNISFQHAGTGTPRVFLDGHSSRICVVFNHSFYIIDL